MHKGIPWINFFVHYFTFRFRWWLTWPDHVIVFHGACGFWQCWIMYHIDDCLQLIIVFNRLKTWFGSVIERFFQLISLLTSDTADIDNLGPSLTFSRKSFLYSGCFSLIRSYLCWSKMVSPICLTNWCKIDNLTLPFDSDSFFMAIDFGCESDVSWILAKLDHVLLRYFSISDSSMSPSFVVLMMPLLQSFFIVV